MANSPDLGWQRRSVVPHRAGYSLRSCTQYAMNSDPQSEPCCDECDHPAWKRSERPLFDHPVETEPDLGAGWGLGDLHMTTDPNDPINHPLHDGAELWLQICLSEGADPVEIAYPSLTDDERQEPRECIAQDGAPQGRVLCRRRRGDRRPAVRVGRPDRWW